MLGSNISPRRRYWRHLSGGRFLLFPAAVMHTFNASTLETAKSKLQKINSIVLSESRLFGMIQL